ncbi:ABC transporter ATP-binding protein [Parvibaculum sp.]|uniref:ABC transporter ATP-binding protein n=1 Tax=Parvibaculum sp. TaxID=2024848 RepID=UPI00320E990D
MPAPYLVFNSVSKNFGALEVVAPSFDLEVKRREFVVFLGPSGSGKTTLMRMVGGLETPSKGQITIDGQPVEGPDRSRGMVFQSYSSFPWLTVAQNVAFGMKYRLDISPKKKKERLAHYLALVGLADFANVYPNKVSGGMRQRIAIARTLAAGSEILLMDEPFGALDAQRREDLQLQLRLIQQQDAKTVIFVTHDVDEAVFLADRIIVFSKRPARMLEEIDVTALLGTERTLALRDSEAFFHLRTKILRLVRASAGAEE